MTNQEALQILKAKQAHLRDSIDQLQRELLEEQEQLAAIDVELSILSKEGNK